jgi:hypothetical protein
MKAKILIPMFTALLISACTSTYFAGFGYDDLYYRRNNNTQSVNNPSSSTADKKSDEASTGYERYRATIGRGQASDTTATANPGAAQAWANQNSAGNNNFNAKSAINKPDSFGNEYVPNNYYTDRFLDGYDDYGYYDPYWDDPLYYSPGWGFGLGYPYGYFGFGYPWSFYPPFYYFSGGYYHYAPHYYDGYRRNIVHEQIIRRLNTAGRYNNVSRVNYPAPVNRAYVPQVKNNSFIRRAGSTLSNRFSGHGRSSFAHGSGRRGR